MEERGQKENVEERRRNVRHGREQEKSTIQRGRFLINERKRGRKEE